jgi:poly(A) polymerase
MMIDKKTAKPIPGLTKLLKDVSPVRLFEESLKLLQTGDGFAAYLQLRELKIFHYLFPTIADRFTKNKTTSTELMIEIVLRNTDERVKSNMRINPAFLLAAMLWYPQLELAQLVEQDRSLTQYESFTIAMKDSLNKAHQSLSIPKHMMLSIRDIWLLQLRMLQKNPRRARISTEHPKFHAAYDLLVLRSKVENCQKLVNLATWWQSFRCSSENKRKVLTCNTHSEQS